MPGGAGYNYTPPGGGEQSRPHGPGGFDGPPSSNGQISRGPPSVSGGPYRGPPSVAGGYPHGPPPSVSTGGGPARGPNPYGPGLGYDPAKPRIKEKVIKNSGIDLPAMAHDIMEGNNVRFNFPSALPDRPATNTSGREVKIRVNQFRVYSWPQDDIYQYDLTFGNGAESAGKVKAMWKSPHIQNWIKKQTREGGPFIWDGAKIGWCKFRLPAATIDVNLDTAKIPPRVLRPGQTPDICKFQIRPTSTVRMATILAYLNRQMPFDPTILESISLLDHIMRAWPSERYTNIKRSFFSHGDVSVLLDQCILAMKGVYSSMRLCNPIPSVPNPNLRAPKPTGLAINVDVANATFWIAQDLHQCARNYLRQRNPGKSYEKMIELLYPVKTAKNDGSFVPSEDFKMLRKLLKLRFKVKHRQKGDDAKTYSIKSFTWGLESKYGKIGMNAKNTMFKLKSKVEGGQPEEISVYDYFKRTYNISIQWWQLPLVITDKGGMFPMEVCSVLPHQRYLYKLSPDQTAAMIKFAVTRPKERIQSIRHGIDMLDWSKDRYLKYFNIEVDSNMTETKACLLTAPEIGFGGTGKVAPGTTGRWDLRGKKFYSPNPEPLASWGILVLQGAVNPGELTNFVNVFIQTYISHGGVVRAKNPTMTNLSKSPFTRDDIEEGVTAARAAAGQRFNLAPQIMFVIMPGRDSHLYAMTKHVLDCKWAMVSQFIAAPQCKKASPQYCSNVAMKVNAKLGGTTSKVIVPKGKDFFTGKTMVIGADVSHATPGSPQASMAAITVSMDDFAGRYAAAVETNGSRVEMITKENCFNMLGPLFKIWCKKHQGCPEHVYYFRDGVSEGQFSHVLNQEVKDMKEAMLKCYPNADANMLKALTSIKWTVTVCTKRHHIRFFPSDQVAGDRNGNPHPGVLVENDITHPFEYDFYLNSHSAIQGTARPVHYQVILDEIKPGCNRFQQMIYHHCYQYMRSTTPVSLYPAVYYAHLASNRARSHEAIPEGTSTNDPRGGQKFEELQQRRNNARIAAMNRGDIKASDPEITEPINLEPLRPMGDPDKLNQAIVDKMRLSMWYI